MSYNLKFLTMILAMIACVSFAFPQVTKALTISTPFTAGERWMAGGSAPVNSGYCQRAGSYYGMGYHKGKDFYAIDFNGIFNSSCGLIADDRRRPVLAIAPGTVSFINSNANGGGYGYFIDIDHGSGYISRYAHLEEDPARLVSRGQKVNRGQRIGLVGSTGGDWGPHLHFVLYRNGMSVRPTPMDGQTLLDHENGKLILSKNTMSAPAANPAPAPKVAPKPAPAPRSTVGTAPMKAPIIYTPARNEMLDKAPLIRFTWQDVRYAGSGNLQYRFHIFTPTQSSAIFSSAWNTNWTSFSKGFSTWNGTNHLRFAVQVKNSKNQILQSEVRHFYLNFPPNQPTSLAPANNAVVAPTFTLSWRDGGDRDNYPKASRNFSARLYRNNQLFRTSVWRPLTHWTIAVDPGTYQWEVCSDDGAWQTCSPKRTFRVN